MLIFDLWGMSFYAAVVFGLGKDLSFKSVLGQYGALRAKQYPCIRNLTGPCMLKESDFNCKSLNCFLGKTLGASLSLSLDQQIVIIACMHFSTLNVFEVLEVLYVFKLRGKN